MDWSAPGSPFVQFRCYAADNPALASLPLPQPGAGRRLQVVCVERAPLPPLPLMVLDEATHEAWMLGAGTRRFAESRMPPTRPASVGAALPRAVGSLAWPPLAIGAVGYAGYRAARRSFRRRMLHAETEVALTRWLADHAGDGAAYRSVRSFQISGNSTTSSIVRR